MSIKVKDGDLYAGRPIKTLTEEEAAHAISLQAVDQDLIDSFYGKKKGPKESDSEEAE